MNVIHHLISSTRRCLVTHLPFGENNIGAPKMRNNFGHISGYSLSNIAIEHFFFSFFFKDVTLNLLCFFCDTN